MILNSKFHEKQGERSNLEMSRVNICVDLYSKNREMTLTCEKINFGHPKDKGNQLWPNNKNTRKMFRT